MLGVVTGTCSLEKKAQARELALLTSPAGDGRVGAGLEEATESSPGVGITWLEA